MPVATKSSYFSRLLLRMPIAALTHRSRSFSTDAVRSAYHILRTARRWNTAHPTASNYESSCRRVRESRVSRDGLLGASLKKACSLAFFLSLSLFRNLTQQRTTLLPQLCPASQPAVHGCLGSVPRSTHTAGLYETVPLHPDTRSHARPLY